jgi:hypothetical protein
MNLVAENSGSMAQSYAGPEEYSGKANLNAVSFSALCIVVGLRWDLSWHLSVGRDNFFSPPHILIYLGGLLGGMSPGIKMIRDSFFSSQQTKKSRVRIWGIFYGSTGGLFCIWGACAMLTSAPFDDWWHNAYGLDIVIRSPPHSLLGMGMFFLQFGACVEISKQMNLMRSINRKGMPNNLRILFIISAGSLLSMMSLWVIDYVNNRHQRSPSFYLLTVLVILPFLPALGKQLLSKYSLTILSAACFMLSLVTNWILQLMPAKALLGPILNPITHLQSLSFPVLLFIPAYVLDLILLRQERKLWTKSLLSAFAFVSILVAVQYPLSGFLFRSPAARNWFFGSEAWAYNLPPDWEFRYQYQTGEEGSVIELLPSLGLAVLLATICVRLSLVLGNWLQKIKR